ncbi:MAG: chorismate mutase [Eubacteriales bacterium]
MIAIRGAITVKTNSEETINEATKELLKTILKSNNLKQEDLISIIFSATNDLNKQYPAVAAREIGLTDTPLFCVQEMNVEESLNMCIRVLLHSNKNIDKDKVKHIYLKDAKKLRPDIR